MEDKRNAYNILVVNTEGKTPFGSLRCRMNLREIGWEVVGWMCLAQGKDQ
jgi:hypothetical protein